MCRLRFPDCENCVTLVGLFTRVGPIVFSLSQTVCKVSLQNGCTCFDGETLRETSTEDGALEWVSSAVCPQVNGQVSL